MLVTMALLKLFKRTPEQIAETGRFGIKFFKEKLVKIAS